MRNPCQAGGNSPSSIFARPVNASKFPIVTPIGLNAPVWPRQLMWTLAAVTCGLLIGLARPDSAQNVPSSAEQPERGRQRDAFHCEWNEPTSCGAGSSGHARRGTRAGRARREPTARNLLHADSAQRSVLRASTARARAGESSCAASRCQACDPHCRTACADRSLRGQWAYTGTITQGDQTIALLENTQTKEGQFLKVGDRLMGAQVKSVTDQMVTLEASGKPRMLAKSDNITVTPLDRSAAPTPAAQPRRRQQGSSP